MKWCKAVCSNTTWFLAWLIHYIWCTLWTLQFLLNNCFKNSPIGNQVQSDQFVWNSLKKLQPDIQLWAAITSPTFYDLQCDMECVLVLMLVCLCPLLILRVLICSEGIEQVCTVYVFGLFSYLLRVSVYFFFFFIKAARDNEVSS